MVTNLAINGIMVIAPVAPNTTFTTTVGTVTTTIIVNEQIVTANSITVNALHVTATDSLTGTTTDIIVAQAYSDINCVVAPTPTPTPTPTPSLR
ncbi:MAG: hypothetical protein H0W28_02640 [Pyrinomonadaceae bacterium]|nr:hypothetical protein [Pyrinomonadaceae bacterium]